MEFNPLTIIATIINLLVLAALIIRLYKIVPNIKGFAERNRALNKKVDAILNKLEIKDND